MSLTLNLADRVIPKKEAERLNRILHFDLDLALRLAALPVESLADALWVEIHGRNRKEMVARLQRRLVRVFTDETERHVQKYRDRHGA
jgi:hypothetical protein